MRYPLLGLLLFAVYAATAGFATSPESHYGESEAHHLLSAESLVTDGDLDLSDEYSSVAVRESFPRDLRPNGRLTSRGLLEPYGPGFSAVIAPAYALAGARGAALLCAALAALAFVLALALARRVVPEPWATRGVLLVALSPPALAHSTSVDPGWAVSALLGIAILLTASAREEARLPVVTGAAAALAILPWIDATAALAGLPVAVLLVHWTLRQHRRLAALIGLEVLSSSLIAYTSLSEYLYGGLTPLVAALPGEAAVGADSALGYLARAPRLASLWLDRDFGLIRWAPVLALAVHGIWLLWRSRRDLIARALPGRREGEAVAGLVTAAGGTLVLVAAFAAVDVSGDSFPGRWLLPGLPLGAVLVAWSLRHLPRTGVALGLLTMLGSAWLCVELASGAVGGWAAARGSRAPWGPLEAVLPAWGTGSAWADAVAVGLVVALSGLLITEWRAQRHRRTAGARSRV